MIQIFDKKGFTTLLTIDSPTLCDADLSGCQLGEANMVQYDLRNTCLKGSNLRDADLRLTRLDHADLRDADLTNADLSGANLSAAQLQGAILTNTTLIDAKLPDNFNQQQPGRSRLSAIPVSNELATPLNNQTGGEAD